MSEFTKGPWEVRGLSIFVSQPHPDSRHRSAVQCIANIADGWEGERGKANARLIAAAPDLLEACKDLLGPAEEWADRLAETGNPEECRAVMDIVRAAQAAIDKARGEDN